MAKMIPLDAWAALRYDPPPSAFVLRQWCRRGEIHPAPERVGKRWMILETARRITGNVPVNGGLLAQLGAQ